jgi:DNA repair ATPase RecN
MTRTPLDRLTSLSEDVIDKASKNPTGARVLQVAAQLKDRVDDLSKQVRGLEAMDKRLAQLEKRVSKIEYAAKKKPPPARKTTAPKKPDA